MLDAAAAAGANIAVLQEAWTCPFFFCTREKYPWLELAENAATGESVQFIQRKAKELNMVIVTSILEIDENHADTIWNTCVVISNKYVPATIYHIPSHTFMGLLRNTSHVFVDTNLSRSIFHHEL